MLEFLKSYYSTKIESRQDLITIIYVLVDDFYRKYTPDAIQHRKGIERMKMSDSEIIAISIFGELCSIDSERSLYSYCKKNFHNLFHEFCERSRFNRIRNNLHKVIQLIYKKIIKLLFISDILIIDSLPIAVCHFGRAHFHKTFRGYGAVYGRCASKKMTYFGYKLHLLCTLSGLPVDFILTSANVDDRKIVPEFADENAISVLIADKGYIGKEFEEAMFKTYGICMLPIDRKKSERYNKSMRQIIFKKRRRIETTISQLSDQLNLQKVRAKSLLGLYARLYSKFLAFIVGVVINLIIQFPKPIAIKHLAF